MKHYLKTWMPFYQECVEGIKTFDVRENDRNFQLKDILVLQEYNRDTSQYTGRESEFVVTYGLYGGSFGVDKDYVVLAITPFEQN